MLENKQDEPTAFIVDDRDEVLQSLKWLIESTGTRVETFSSPTRFLEERHWDRPGCLVLDLQMDEMNGLELQRRLIERKSLLPIIVMTAHSSVPAAVTSLTNGAIHYLEKPFSDKILLDLIERGIRQNGLARTERARAEKVHERLSRLTGREHRVLELVVQGYSNKEIAHKLILSEKTIEVHRGHMMAKMGAKNGFELAAMVHGLVPHERS